jgi:sulfate permease, SulP family
MDLTGIHTLSETIQELRKKWVSVVLCQANERVREKLLRAGLLEANNDMSCNWSLGEALARFARAA